MQTGHGLDTCGPLSKDNYPKGGTGGGYQLSETGKEGKRIIEDAIRKVRYFIGSSAVLGMLKMESGRFRGEGYQQHGEQVVLPPRRLQFC